MNKTGIENMLKHAVNNAPTIPFEKLAAMEFVKMPEHDYITKQEETNSSSRIRKLTLVATSCFLILVLVSGWFMYNKSSDSIIMLDVNPSIEIRTNYRNQILSIMALNEDARAVLKDCDYNGNKLDQTVTALMNALVEHQYLNTDKNTILLTVMNKNSKKAERIIDEMDFTIRESLDAQNIAPTIMRQVINKEAEQSELAARYHVSEGKMKLIKDMIDANDKFTLDMLAKMSVQQLFNLAKDNSIDLSKYLSEKDNEAARKSQETGDVSEDADTKDAYEGKTGKSEVNKETSEHEADYEDGKEQEENRDNTKEIEENSKDDANEVEENNKDDADKTEENDRSNSTSEEKHHEDADKTEDSENENSSKSNHDRESKPVTSDNQYSESNDQGENNNENLKDNEQKDENQDDSEQDSEVADNEAADDEDADDEDADDEDADDENVDNEDVDNEDSDNEDSDNEDTDNEDTDNQVADNEDTDDEDTDSEN